MPSRSSPVGEKETRSLTETTEKLPSQGSGSAVRPKERMHRIPDMQRRVLGHSWPCSAEWRCGRRHQHGFHEKGKVLLQRKKRPGSPTSMFREGRLTFDRHHGAEQMKAANPGADANAPGPAARWINSPTKKNIMKGQYWSRTAEHKGLDQAQPKHYKRRRWWSDIAHHREAPRTREDNIRKGRQ